MDTPEYHTYKQRLNREDIMKDKHCTNCGHAVDSATKYCPNCGNDAFQEIVNDRERTNRSEPQRVVIDQAGCLVVLLSFIFPIVGLVLFLVWMNTRPNSAKAVGIAALIGFLLQAGGFSIYV